MAEEFSSQEKNEAPTQRRRDEARRKGQVAQSQDLTTALLLLSGTGLLWGFSDSLGRLLVDMMRQHLGNPAHTEWTWLHTMAMYNELSASIAMVLLPVMGLMLLAAVGSTAGQVGLFVSWEPLRPDWSRISVTTGWSRLFSLRSTIRGVMVVPKLTLAVLAITWLLRSKIAWLFQASHASLRVSTTRTWHAALMLSAILGGMLLLVGLSDYLYQWWQQEKDLRMSRQDLKDEHKREEGDPKIKSQMKKQQRAATQRKMLTNVPEASVVLTNPTHIAVALKYDRQSMAAPVVVAKGTGALAMRIRRIAQEHGIPVLERKPLARALHAMVDVDQEIPMSLYKAIAEILAYVYRLGKAA